MYRLILEYQEYTVVWMTGTQVEMQSILDRYSNAKNLKMEKTS